MTAANPIVEILAAPLRPGWTIVSLVQQLLDTIAALTDEDVKEFVLDGETVQDRQSQRLLRPLLACLAAQSATDAGTAPNIYVGQISFRRVGPKGPVWISGHFENKSDSVRVVLQRTALPPEHSILPKHTGSPNFENPASSAVSPG